MDKLKPWKNIILSLTPKKRNEIREIIKKYHPSRQYYHSVKNGLYNPSPELQSELASYLGINPHYLVHGSGDMYRGD